MILLQGFSLSVVVFFMGAVRIGISIALRERNNVGNVKRGIGNSFGRWDVFICVLAAFGITKES
jgi:hypothetical protein